MAADRTEGLLELGIVPEPVQGVPETKFPDMLPIGRIDGAERPAHVASAVAVVPHVAVLVGVVEREEPPLEAPLVGLVVGYVVGKTAPCGGDHEPLVPRGEVGRHLQRGLLRPLALLPVSRFAHAAPHFRLSAPVR